MPIPYEIIEQGRALIQFAQAPVQIVTVWKQLEDSGLLQAAYMHPIPFSGIITLPLVCIIPSLFIYCRHTNYLKGIPIVLKLFFGWILSESVKMIFSMIVSNLKFIIAIQWGPTYEIMSIIDNIPS